jgi:hypothetical protein
MRRNLRPCGVWRSRTSDLAVPAPAVQVYRCCTQRTPSSARDCSAPVRPSTAIPIAIPIASGQAPRTVVVVVIVVVAAIYPRQAPNYPQ